jgi:clathrin heavy chain
LNAKKKLKQVELSENVEYWSWVNSSKLGVVTNASIYHVDITNASSAAEKIFDRDPRLSGAHIMGYRINNSGQWCFLYGIGTNDLKQVVGHLQLYMIEKKQG